MEQKTFSEQAACIVRRVYEFNEKERRFGLLDLNARIDMGKAKRRDIFELGMHLALNVASPEALEHIDKILSNIIMSERDDGARRLKTIQREAVPCVLAGLHPRLLLYVLFSHIRDDEMEDIRGLLADSEIFDTIANMEE